MLDLLKKLCGAYGPSGNEDEVAQMILDEIEGYADCRRDRLGNVIAFKKGESRPRSRLMLCAHMDEVGLMVTGVDDGGFLKFDFIGGVDPRVAAGRRVLIGRKKIPGVIGAKVWHLCSEEERKTAPSAEKLFLDIGAGSREEALRSVSLGDEAVFDSEFTPFGGGFVKGRAIDDRVGCAVLIEMIRSPLRYDTCFAFTVQEEVGARGAKTAAFAVKPEAAVVVEATTASDIPFTDEQHKVCFLSKGPVLSFMDRATVYDRGLYQMAGSLAAEKGIPCQPKLAVAGGNDAGNVHVSRDGVRTIAVSLPCRYLHSPSCVIKWSDAEHTLELVRALSEKISGTRMTPDD